MELTLKAKIKRQTVVGTWSMLGSSMAAEALATSGLDYVIVDLEHGVFDFERVVDIVRAIQLHGCSAIIRSSTDNASHLLRCLECKPNGILVPHIKSFEQAKAVVDSCYYKPSGTRGLSPYTRVHNFTHENLAESMNKANEELFVGVLLEGKEGIENAGAISQLPGLDLLYFGIYDFTASLGYRDEINHPEVQKHLEHMVQMTGNSGVAAGTFVRTIADAARYKSLGMRFIAYGSDSMIMRDGFKRITQELQ